MNMVTFADAMKARQDVKIADRQDPLMADYRVNPENAAVTDSATTRRNGVSASSALHTAVTPDKGGTYPIGVHTAVGGESDFATPGDLLCAAIAACLDSTIRLITNRLGVSLTHLSVDVEGDVDVRGALRVCEETPVGFQRFRISVDMQTAAELPTASRAAIIAAAEHSCVVLQTIRGNPEVSMSNENKSLKAA